MNYTQDNLVSIGSPSSDMRSLTEKKYIFHNDPGHGWIAVPFHHLQILGIVDKITPYSYRSGNTAFLEEDCDYTTFVQAWQQFTGLTFDPNERTIDRYQEQSGVRNFPGWYL